MYGDVVSWCLLAFIITERICLFAGRNWLKARVEKGVQFNFDTKLDSLRLDIRKTEELFKSEIKRKEDEFAALRANVYDGRSNRRGIIDKRRVEAIESLWSATMKIGRYEYVATFLTTINLKELGVAASKDARVKTFIDAVIGEAELANTDIPKLQIEELFVTEASWAYYSAYRLVIVIAVMRANALKSGLLDAEQFIKMDSVNSTIIKVLPDRQNYIEKYPEIGVFHLLAPLRAAVLKELRRELDGEQADKEDIKRATEIAEGVRAASEELRKNAKTIEAAQKA